MLASKVFLTYPVSFVFGSQGDEIITLCWGEACVPSAVRRRDTIGQRDLTHTQDRGQVCWMAYACSDMPQLLTCAILLIFEDVWSV